MDPNHKKIVIKKNELEYVACPLCDQQDDVILSNKGFPNVDLTNVICRKCALIRINPRMTEKNYQDFYAKDFFEYLNPFNRPAYVDEIENTTNDAVVTPTKRLIIPFIRTYVPKGGKVLDIGAGFGQVLYLLQKEKGISYVGLEPDPYSCEVAKNKIGIDLVQKTIEEFVETNTDMFDFIVLNQTFEHLLHPLVTLKHLAKMLKPEGAIYIGVPNAYNPQIPMRLFYQFAHTYNYTPYSMNLFAEKSGLKMVDIKDPRGYPLEVILSLKTASYPEVAESIRMVGKDWRDVRKQLRRKKYLNMFRGGTRALVGRVLGQKVTDNIRNTFDRIVHYKY